MKQSIKLIIFSYDKSKVLMCTGAQPSLPSGPYRDDEIAFDAAYRLLAELTGIEDTAIILKPLAAYSDRCADTYTDVWFGCLETDYGIANDNEFIWADADIDVIDGITSWLLSLGERYI